MSLLYGAEALNRKASADKNKPDEIIRSLEIRKGSIIVDIGAGGGYYSIRFAEETGLGGEVYAVDVNGDFLQHIDFQAKHNGLNNIKTVLVEEKAKGLPERGCDLIFFRNIYHHIHQPEAYFKEIKRFLKPNGRIAVIDYKKINGFSFINLIGHFVNEIDMIAVLENVGFTPIKSFDFLPKQSFNIFQLK